MSAGGFPWRKRFSTWARSDLAVLLLLSGLVCRAQSLNEAIAAGDSGQVAVLLSAGAPVNTRNDLGRTPLLEAVWADRADLVRMLIERGADVTARHSDGGSTPLDYAALRGNNNIASLLLRAGARPDEAALGLAAVRDNAEIARSLIEAGATASSEAFDEAVRHRSLSVLGVLLSKNSAHMPELLNTALRRGDTAIVAWLAERGADVNRRDQFGATPLHDAAAGGNAAMLRVLLDHGAQIDAVTSDSRTTALYEAAAMGRTDAVTVLLERGADPNLLEKSGHRALHAALAGGFTSTAEVLRKHGARDDSLTARKNSSRQ
jgi:ankyrin repeat protein